MSRPLFTDRSDAGRQLAIEMKKLVLQQPVVYALPRGGVPVAFEVATALGAPLDLLLVRKLGAPHQPELAVGAVVDGETPEVVLNADIAAAVATNEYIAAAKAVALREIERRRALYLRGRAATDPSGRDAIVIDDGVATGATALVAVHALKRRGARRVIVATPVAPPDTVARLAAEADQVVCLAQPDWFSGISQFYLDFHQLEDEEVVELLDRASVRPAAPPKRG
jgi:predicted phosphoribosyltransferase